MHPPPLSLSQRAYLFQRESFLTRIEERAARLGQDGYTVEPDCRPCCFVILPPGENPPYLVDALRQTCTCCFYRKQVQGEPLTKDGVIVACKHLRGLHALIRSECLQLKTEARWCCLYRLRAHWLITLAARAQEEQQRHGLEASQEASCSPTLLCRCCTAQRNECETTRNAKGDRGE